MFDPASLQIPGIFGSFIGWIVGVLLWDFNPILAVIAGLVILGFGMWLGWWWSKKFYESLEKDYQKRLLK